MSEALQKEIAQFIREHRNGSIPTLALQLSKKPHLPSLFILNQINGLQKAQQKVPFLLDYAHYLYPNPTSFAQASSEKAARYKAEFFQNLIKVADLSGGMGIDTYFLSLKCQDLDYVETNEELFDLSRENFKTLGMENVHSHHSTAEEFINSSSEQYDLIYLDPDRRKENKRVIQITDCEPNAAALAPQLFEKTKQILIKYSPMLDIKSAIKELPNTAEVHVLSIDNECKELLFLLKKGWDTPPLIRTVNLHKMGRSEFNFLYAEEEETFAEISEVEKYIYEPNSAILKAGAFNLIGHKFGIGKLAFNTHLYTSPHEIKEFPGRRLKVLKTSSKTADLTSRANIVNRNSGLTVEQIKKKFKVIEGGEQFVYACRLENGKRIFILAELII